MDLDSYKVGTVLKIDAVVTRQMDGETELALLPTSADGEAQCVRLSHDFSVEGYE